MSMKVSSFFAKRSWMFLVGGVCAILLCCLGANSAFAANGNYGGLVFTPSTSSAGPTEVTISYPDENGVVTVKQNDPDATPVDFTVTQVKVSDTAIATAIKLVDYAGTITLDNVTLYGPTAAGAEGTDIATIDFAGTDATVMLTGGSSISAGTKDGNPANAITGMLSAINYGGGSGTLILEGGSTVTGYGVPAINIALANDDGDSTTNTLQFDGISTVSMATPLAAGAAEGAMNSAIVVSDTPGDDPDNLNIVVGANATVNGAKATTASIGSDALAVLGGNVTVSGEADLTLNGGAGFASAEATQNGAAAVIVSNAVAANGCSLTFDGPGAVNIRGGAGADNNGQGTDGGEAIYLDGTATANTPSLVINGGTINAQGGNGGVGSETSGGAGGEGINNGNIATTAVGSTITINGGTVNVTAGSGGALNADTGNTGTAGVGMALGENGAKLNVQYDQALADAAPNVTIQGGVSGDKEAMGSAITGTDANINVTSEVLNNGKPTTKPTTYWNWAAISKTPVVAEDTPAVLPDQANLAGFAGMATISPTVGSNLIGTGGKLPNWAQFLTAPITNLNAGVNQYNATQVSNTNYYTPATYIVAQSTLAGTPTAMTSKTSPAMAYTYQPTVTATFEGLTNLNTTNFADLSGIGTAGTTAYAPSENVQAVPNNKNAFYVIPTATGNELTITLGGTNLDNASTFKKVYPTLTAEPQTYPVVYTILLQQSTVNNDGTKFLYVGTDPATTNATAWNLYTNPNGEGTLVFGNGMGTNDNKVPTTQGETGDPTWGAGDTVTTVTSLPTTTTTQTLPGFTGAGSQFVINPAGTATNFLGYYNETPTTPADWTQVNINQINGWSSNAQLTPEWGTLELTSIAPTPTTVEQGASVDVTATWTAAPANDKIESYNISSAGLPTGWTTVFENALGTGSGAANGLTANAGAGTCEPGPNGTFTVTQVGTVAANATCDTGSYRVYPTLANNDGNVSATSGVYGVVKVTEGTQPSAQAVNVLRVSNPNTGEHIYTTDANEQRVLVNMYGWNDEGIAWVAPKSSGVNIFRLYNPNNGDHMYTVSENEYDALGEGGWTKEGVQLYGGPENGPEIYRLYNPNMTANGGAYAHLWTADYNEYNVLGTSHSWKQEGVAWYALDVTLP